MPVMSVFTPVEACANLLAGFIRGVIHVLACIIYRALDAICLPQTVWETSYTPISRCVFEKLFTFVLRISVRRRLYISARPKRVDVATCLSD